MAHPECGRHSLKQYDYTYDALNRITGAIDDTENFGLNGVSYDKNGNIQNLSRQGHIVANPILGFDDDNDGQDDHYGLMDNLVYEYTGNQLTEVTDQSSVVYGFNDGNVVGSDYVYDNNGNLTSDLNKGITAITYNHLNLPTQVSVDNAPDIGAISYIYDATGVKLQKNVLKNRNTTSTDYANGYAYENSTLQFFNHPEGYVFKDSR